MLLLKCFLVVPRVSIVFRIGDVIRENCTTLISSAASPRAEDLLHHAHPVVNHLTGSIGLARAAQYAAASGSRASE